MSLRSLVRRGMTVRVEVTQPGMLALAMRTGDVLSARQRGQTAPEPRQLLLTRASRRLNGPGAVSVRLRPSRKARRQLLRARRVSRARLTAQLTTDAGAVEVADRRLRLT